MAPSKPCSECEGNGECHACSGTGVDVGVAVLAGYEGDCERCGGTGACPVCGGSGEEGCAPVAEPFKDAGKPPPAPPLAERKFPQFEPHAPSPELAACIRLWIDETPADGLKYLCKENDAIWLHATLIYLWLLRPDGQVLCIDHESFARRAEPETDPVRAYAALAQGAREHPELGELLPPDRAGLRECERCGGAGWTPSPPPAMGSDYCQRCGGMGWYVPGNKPNS